MEDQEPTGLQIEARLDEGGDHPVVQLGAAEEFSDETDRQEAEQTPGESAPQKVQQLPYVTFLRERNYVSVESQQQNSQKIAKSWRKPQVPARWDHSKTLQTCIRRIAEASSWSREEGVFQTIVDLSEEIIQACRRGLQVKQEVVDEDTASLEIRQQQFRQFCYLEDEGPREVCSQLKDLCYRWLQPEKHSKEQILELVILEQFLAILPHDMQIWVRNQGPETCAQAVALSEVFLWKAHEKESCNQQVRKCFSNLCPDL